MKRDKRYWIICVILVVGLIILAYTENPVATLSADSVLTERRLDFRTLVLNLTEEEFTNPGGLQVSNFNLANAPAGLSIESVTGISIWDLRKFTRDEKS